MSVNLKKIGQTWWGEPEYQDLKSGRKVRWTWATKLFYYVDTNEYIFDEVIIMEV